MGLSSTGREGAGDEAHTEEGSVVIVGFIDDSVTGGMIVAGDSADDTPV